MKKFLTLTIIAIIALIGLSVSVNAAEMTASEFLADLADGKMSEDITLTEKVVIEEDTTLDLNGKTLTMTNGAYFSIKNGTVTIKNGTIDAEKYALYVNANNGNAVLNIESDVTVKAVEWAVLIVNEGSVLNTKGNLISTGNYATINGSGNTGCGGVEVNILGGSVTNENVTAVYFPNTTELNISGGTITGATAVYHKSGKLNITDGELIGAGAKVEYVYHPSGCNETGDALVIEACDYPGGVPVVSITGGTFISENNQAIGYYQQTEEYKLANEKFITGGAFSSDISEHVPAGYVTNKVYTYEVDMYEVKLNRPYVTNDYITEDDEITGEIEIGVASELEGELENIFEQEIESNETLKQALLDGKSVNIHVQIDRVEESDINEDELDAIISVADGASFVKFYDITLAMIADGTQIDTISEISNKLTFKVFIPEDLIKDGRTFFMYRYHKGEVEKITGELDEENYFTFETDKFSTYVLAYEDEVDEPTAGGEDTTIEDGAEDEGTAEKEPEDKKDDTPTTGSIDVVLFVSAIVAVISVAGIALVKKYTR